MCFFQNVRHLFRSSPVGNARVGTQNQQNREIWLEKTLADITAGSRILDAGAGESQYKKFCSHLDYVSQDFGKYNGTGNKTGLQMGAWDNTQLDIISEITSIPEPDQSFDAVMCIEVFEHLPDPVAAIKEFSRLLKEGGVLLLTAPFASLTHFAPYHFSSGFNAYFYQTHLPENGFDIEVLEANGNFFEFIAQELRRTPKLAKQYCDRDVTRKERLAIKIILSMLHRFSEKDRSSEELLCFGYHVKAVKK